MSVTVTEYNDCPKMTIGTLQSDNGNVQENVNEN